MLFLCKKFFADPLRFANYPAVTFILYRSDIGKQKWTIYTTNPPDYNVKSFNMKQIRKKHLNMIDFVHSRFSKQYFDRERAILQYSTLLYKNMDNCTTFYDKLTENAIYNLAYSKDGSMVLAGYERGSICAFHPLFSSVKPMFRIENAHVTSVNGFQFIDSTKFTSCSDDTTVKLWDIRNINSAVQTLSELSDWAKNIHYNHEDKILITSDLRSNIAVYEMDCDTFKPIVLLEHKTDLLRTALMNDCDTLFLTEFNTGKLQCIRNFKRYIQKIRENCEDPVAHIQIGDEDLIQATDSFESQQKGNETIEKTFLSSLAPHPLDWCIAVRGIRQSDSNNYTFVLDMHNPSNGYSRPTLSDQPTLTHFLKESNAKRDFIKEISFSYDGRVIASPHAKGFRLFAFGNDCPHYAPKRLAEVTELITVHYGISDGYIYTTKFSPTDFHFAVGCSKGTIKFCYPKL